MNIELLRGMDNVTLAKALMNLNNKMMKEILKLEGVKKLYKMKKDQLQDCILELVYQTSMFSNIEPVAPATEETEVIEVIEIEPEVIEIDEVLPAIIEEQELISQDKFKEILNFIMFDDLGGLEVLKSEGFKVGYSHLEDQLTSLICCDVFPEIFAIDSEEGLYNPKAYNELFFKMLNMAEVTGNNLLKEMANYGFSYMAKEIEAMKNHDPNNPPF